MDPQEDDWSGLIDGIRDSQLHIQTMSDKIYDLTMLQQEAERQVFHRLRILYSDGKVTVLGLLDAYQMWASQCCYDGWQIRWTDAGLPSEDDLHELFTAGLKHRPNEPHGWSGDWRKATPATPIPARGQSVVYILYDARNEPCYVGSTGDFPVRLAAHRRDGKKFTRWSAYPCSDRQAAYRLEDRLLKEHLPYLNKRASA